MSILYLQANSQKELVGGHFDAFSSTLKTQMQAALQAG